MTIAAVKWCMVWGTDKCIEQLTSTATVKRYFGFSVVDFDGWFSGRLGSRVTGHPSAVLVCAYLGGELHVEVIPRLLSRRLLRAVHSNANKISK